MPSFTDTFPAISTTSYAVGYYTSSGVYVGYHNVWSEAVFFPHLHVFWAAATSGVGSWLQIQLKTVYMIGMVKYRVSSTFIVQPMSRLCFLYMSPHCAVNTFKRVMTWAKVTSLVCRFWSLPWTNGPNTQFKWKLRYSSIQCRYLKPLDDVLFRPLTHQNWPRDKKSTQTCWCLH